MTQKTILQKLGDSLGMILPQPVLDSLNLKEGDELYVTATPEGFLLTSYDPEFSDALEAAREFMRTHRAPLAGLPNKMFLLDYPPAAESIPNA